MVKYCCTFLCSDFLVQSCFILFYPVPPSKSPSLLLLATCPPPPPSLLLVLSPRPTVSCSRTFYHFPALLPLASTSPPPLSYWSDTESPNPFPVTCLPQPPHFPSKKSSLLLQIWPSPHLFPSLYPVIVLVHTHPSYYIQNSDKVNSFHQGL